MSYEDRLNKIAPEMLLTQKKALAVYYNSYCNGKIIKPMQQFFERLKREYSMDDDSLLEIARQCYEITTED
jgi:hypothetical protein